jgi:hypothetical protein
MGIAAKSRRGTLITEDTKEHGVTGNYSRDISIQEQKSFCAKAAEKSLYAKKRE